jgi:outer membrane protein assembly factor BamE (lipoprotein component of BamABCDE complex)
MRRLLHFILIPACLFLVACASSGNPKLKQMEQGELLAQIQEGTTTKAQVEALLGPANGVSFTDSLNEIWTYSHSKMTPHASNFIPYASIFASGQDTVTKELVVVFNQEGVVIKRTMREATTVQKMGIFGKT